MKSTKKPYYMNYQKDNNYKIHCNDIIDAMSFNISKNKLLIKSDIFPENYQLADLMNPSAEGTNALAINEQKVHYLNMP